jgi:hypothetical protein
MIPPATSTVRAALYFACDRALPHGHMGCANPFMSKAHLPTSGGHWVDHLSGPISNSVVAYTTREATVSRSLFVQMGSAGDNT